MAAPLSVEMEVLSAAYDGADTVTVSLEYRLINENTQAVLAHKTVPATINKSMGAFDANDLLRRQYDDAVAWGLFLLSAQKIQGMVGQKVRTVVA
jgi:hypothetical protein